MLSLDYRREAAGLPWPGPIIDVHTHLQDLQATRFYLEVAALFGIQRLWTMTQLEHVDAIRAEFGDRIHFIAVPNYPAYEEPETFTTDWLHRIEAFAEKGCRVCKFWAAPRGLDISPALSLDSPIRHEAMRLARDLGMTFMTHIADPDTWFATKYTDSSRYGTKADHHARLEELLDEFSDVNWIAAHLAGHPEDLDHLQGLLDRHPNLWLDTAATKWMVRELSKHPAEARAFFSRNPGRILFGSDVVADHKDLTFDLIASRYWALRTLFETNYDGPSPIVDPDLAMVDPKVPEDATAPLRGAALNNQTLSHLYHGAAESLLLKPGT